MIKSSPVAKGIPSLILAVALLSAQAEAATSTRRQPGSSTVVAPPSAPATNKTTTSAAPPATPAFVQGPTMTYFSWYQGPSLTAPGSPYQTDNNGYDDLKNLSGFENRLSLGYKLSPEITLLGVADAFYSPMQGHDWTWLDPWIRLKDSNIYTAGEWKLFGEFRLYVPATQASQDKGLLAGFRFQPSVRYTFKGTDWSAGFDSFVRANMYGMTGTGDHVFGYFAPIVDYAIRDNLVWETQYELYGHHAIEGSPPFLDTTLPTDLITSLDWTVASWLDFQPYVAIYPGSFSWSSTSIGAFISGKLF